MKIQMPIVAKDSKSIPSDANPVSPSKVPSNIATLLAQRLNGRQNAVPVRQAVPSRYPKSGKGI